MHKFPTAEDLAQEFLRAIQAKDKDAILSIISDDFILEVPYNISGTNDFSDNWVGVDMVSDNFDKTWKNIEVVKYAEIRVTAGNDPDIAFAETLGNMKLANGRPYRNRYVFRFDTEGGKIKRLREYANPVTSALAFGVPLPRPAFP